MSTYAPTDSPFGDALAAYKQSGGIALHTFSFTALDEFASCAQSLLGTPIYSDDMELADFARAIERTMQVRAIQDRA